MSSLAAVGETNNNNNNDASSGASSSTEAAPADANAVLLLLPTPRKGRADWRSYRCLEIASNGVTVGLVHDPESKTTAAAATVPAGAAMDPRHLPGLAREY